MCGKDKRWGFLAVLVFILFLIVTMPGIAMVYYVDEKGVVHFVEDETLIPDKYKNQKREIEGTRQNGNLEETTKPPTPSQKKAPEGEKLITDKQGNTPAYWRERYKNLQNEKLAKERELREVEEQRDEVSKRYESARSKAFYVGDSQSVTEAASLELKLRDLENRVKMIIKQLDELNKKISVDIYDELLQAGGDPSWLIREE
ncbi:MAG: hypothetical protein OHK0040_08340 [bacterium]